MARFCKFMMTEIFPGGRLPSVRMVGAHAVKPGFTVTRFQSLQSHYPTTLDRWSAALQAHRDETVAVQSEEVYDRYMKYLLGCPTYLARATLAAAVSEAGGLGVIETRTPEGVRHGAAAADCRTGRSSPDRRRWQL